MNRKFINLFCTTMAVGSLFLVGCCKDKDDDTPRVGKSTAVFNPDKTYGTMTDIEGNVYRTITIGTQTWMAENLRTTRYRNGDPIPSGENDEWLFGEGTPGACCRYKNTHDLDSIATFGLLYNGYAVLDPRGLAPDGWHIPTNAEWDTLMTTAADGEGHTQYPINTVAGGRLREAGTLHWGRANRATNSSGFTYLPGGIRNPGKPSFEQVGYCGFCWSASVYVNGLLWYCSSTPDFLSFGRHTAPCDVGMSVRCIKD